MTPAVAADRRTRPWWARAVRVAQVIRRIIGAPDYERYVAHVRAAHPDQQPLSYEEFVRQRLNERYNKPGARCC